MSQKFEIRVISLVNQIDRREKITDLFCDKKLNWSFFDAISGKEIDAYASRYDKKRRLRNLSYDLKPNEIACFISHRKVWEECVRKNVPFLILEDDIKINNNFFVFQDLEKIVNLIIEKFREEFLFVRLGNLFHRKFYPIIPVTEGVDIVRYFRDPSTAMGYILSPHVANKLLIGSERFFCAVDNYMWSGWEHDCCLLDLYPGLFFTSDLDTPSSIGDRSKPRISFIRKMKREYYRLINNIIRSRYERDIIFEIKNNASKFFK